MADMAYDEGTTEEWVVMWFPPGLPDRQSIFNDAKAEEKARRLYEKQVEEESNPILVHRVIEVRERIVLNSVEERMRS